jgi:hypothetical protein
MVFMAKKHVATPKSAVIMRAIRGASINLMLCRVVAPCMLLMRRGVLVDVVNLQEATGGVFEEVGFVICEAMNKHRPDEVCAVYEAGGDVTSEGQVTVYGANEAASVPNRIGVAHCETAVGHQETWVASIGLAECGHMAFGDWRVGDGHANDLLSGFYAKTRDFIMRF